MAGGVRSILIRFLGDSSGLRRATGEAEGGFKSFSQHLDDIGRKVGAAEGLGGKAKAAWGGLGDILSTTGGKAAVASAGVGALAVVAGKAVTEFEDTTVAVGKFRDATGTTSEEASRFVEVFDDLGIGAETGAAAIGNMEKTLGSNTQAFDQFGVSVVRASDGTIDATATFTSAVDALSRIEDPAKRAAAGAAIFGKGWQGMAEVIDGGAPALKTALESVQPSKIFTDADIQSGRDVRDAFDKLADAGQGLMLTLGKALAPAIAEMAPVFADVVEKAGPLVELAGKSLVGSFKLLAPVIEAVTKVIGPLLDGLGKVMDLVDNAASAVEDFFVDMPDGAVAEGAFDKVKRGAQGAGDVVKVTSGVTRDAAAAAKEHAQATKDQAAALEEATRAQEALLAAEMSSIDTGFRLADATQGVADAAANYREDGGATAENLRRVSEAMWAQAQAALANEVALREASGQTLDAGQKQQILRDALASSAQQFPQFAAGAQAMIATLDGIPDAKRVDVTTTGAPAAATSLFGVKDAADKVPSDVPIKPDVVNAVVQLALLRYLQAAADRLAATKISVRPTFDGSGITAGVARARAELAGLQSAASSASASALQTVRSAQSAINQIRATG